jgi:hypothetical protein
VHLAGHDRRRSPRPRLVEAALGQEGVQPAPGHRRRVPGGEWIERAVLGRPTPGLCSSGD